MKIVYCADLEHMAKLIYEFTILGLTFEADTGKLTITLTGGF